MLLTSDLHLDDKEDNEYRWRIFDRLKEHADGEVYILGDLCDRADRHSAILVNRLVAELTDLTLAGNNVTILLGNHDKPLRGPPYFEFLNVLPNVLFVTTPIADGDLLMLPYAVNPAEEWKDITFTDYNCVFMHQTVTGADVGRGRKLENPNMVTFPLGVHVYSGDIHHPQVVDGRVTYVGAPHAVRFGDSHRCRLLMLNSNYDIRREITLRRMRKAIIEISDVRQLDFARISRGDQVRIRFVIPSARMEQWPVEQQTISGWAREKGVTLASVEAIIQGSPGRTEQLILDSNPEQTLRAFCTAEGVAGHLLDAGLEIMRNVK